MIVKIDIKGAFIQTPMQGELTYMKLDKRMMEYIVEMFLKLKEYVKENGCLYILMMKAMYGGFPESALWYALIRKFLEDLGYEVNETD